MYSSSPPALRSAIRRDSIDAVQSQQRVCRSDAEPNSHIPRPLPKALFAFHTQLVPDTDEMAVYLPLLALCILEVLGALSGAGEVGAAVQVEDQLFGELGDGSGGDDQAFASLVLGLALQPHVEPREQLS